MALAFLAGAPAGEIWPRVLPSYGRRAVIWANGPFTASQALLISAVDLLSLRLRVRYRPPQMPAHD